MAEITLKPLNEWYLVKPRPVATQSAHGIIIPPSAAGKANTGTIIKTYDGAPIQEGTLVLYSPFAVIEVSIQGETHVYVKQYDLIADLSGLENHK